MPGRERNRRPHGPSSSFRREPSRSSGRGPRKGGRAAPTRAEAKPELYSLRSVVDHGFEDVPSDEGGETRRLTWTIEKRTVADKKSGRLMSAIYVLERDGVETEFANLGLARAAVHKTITHPERLTRPKAEYAREKK